MVRLGMLLRDMSHRQMRSALRKNCTKKLSRGGNGSTQTNALSPENCSKESRNNRRNAPFLSGHQSQRSSSPIAPKKCLLIVVLMFWRRFLHCQALISLDIWISQPCCGHSGDWRTSHGKWRWAHIRYLHSVKSGNWLKVFVFNAGVEEKTILRFYPRPAIMCCKLGLDTGTFL